MMAKNTTKFARTTAAAAIEDSQNSTTGGPEDLHRAAHETRRGPDQECDDQHRLAVIAPAGREHDDDHQHQRRHGPAQVRGVGILQDQRAELAPR